MPGRKPGGTEPRERQRRRNMEAETIRLKNENCTRAGAECDCDPGEDPCIDCSEYAVSADAAEQMWATAPGTYRRRIALQLAGHAGLEAFRDGTRIEWSYHNGRYVTGD